MHNLEELMELELSRISFQHNIHKSARCRCFPVVKTFHIRKMMSLCPSIKVKHFFLYCIFFIFYIRNNKNFCKSCPVITNQRFFFFLASIVINEWSLYMQQFAKATPKGYIGSTFQAVSSFRLTDSATGLAASRASRRFAVIFKQVFLKMCTDIAT